MENLFIQQAALELRASPFAARFFTPSRAIRSKCMAVVDLGGGEEGDLSDKYHGILDNYLECGQDVAVCFRPPPSNVRGSTEARKLDKPAWVGRFVTPPRQFQREMPSWITLRLALRHRRSSTTSRDHRRWHVFRIQQQPSDIRGLPPLRGYVQDGSPQFQRHCSPCAPADRRRLDQKRRFRGRPDRCPA